MLPTIKFFVLILMFTLLAGFFMVPTRGMPDHAVVLLDDQNRTYLSPVCTGKDQDQKQYRPARAAEARRLKYEPDQKCGGASGFTQDGRSYTGNFLERMGLLPPWPSRWNEDGSWNW
jgi:hypothetical protein